MAEPYWNLERTKQLHYSAKLQDCQKKLLPDSAGFGSRCHFTDRHFSSKLQLMFGEEHGRVVTEALTWHREILSVYDLILSIIELVVILLCVSVQILQVGNHRHTPPRVSALRTGRDRHRGLSWGVFLSHPAVRDGQTRQWVKSVERQLQKKKKKKNRG